MGVLRSLGSEGLNSVRDELTELESEKATLVEQAGKLGEQRDSLAGIGELERQFLDSWRGLGDLLKVATPDEQQRLLRNIIEVVDWTPAPDSSKLGTYAIRFFPEAVQKQAEFLIETWPEGSLNDDDPAGAGPLLSPVRELGSEAPPNVPATNRLTVELGTWYFKHLRQSRTILPLPWKGLKSIPKPAPKPQVLKGDPRARARQLQAMLDTGEVKNKAELARRLGLSRARITQIMSKLPG